MTTAAHVDVIQVIARAIRATAYPVLQGFFAQEVVAFKTCQPRTGFRRLDAKAIKQGVVVVLPVTDLAGGKQADIVYIQIGQQHEFIAQIQQAFAQLSVTFVLAQAVLYDLIQ